MKSIAFRAPRLSGGCNAACQSTSASHCKCWGRGLGVRNEKKPTFQNGVDPAGSDFCRCAYKLCSERPGHDHRNGDRSVRRCCSRCESDRGQYRSEEHTSELQSRLHLVCRLLLEKKKLISVWP